jgi:hypothetical protein
MLFVMQRKTLMKITLIILAAIMTTAAPVFAEQPSHVNYKIKIDRDENFEEQLKKRRVLRATQRKQSFFKLDKRWTRNP